SQVKLIAEPWDLGDRGYQVGQFPLGWSEWNGRYRDTVRRFWRGDPAQLPEMATRVASSSDLYQASARGPDASINFVTSHDGCTTRLCRDTRAQHADALQGCSARRVHDPTTRQLARAAPSEHSEVHTRSPADTRQRRGSVGGGAGDPKDPARLWGSGHAPSQA